MDAATPITTDASPEPGDFSICINCGALLRFAEALAVELVDLAVLVANVTPADARAILQAQRWIRQRGRLDPGRQGA